MKRFIFSTLLLVAAETLCAQRVVLSDYTANRSGDDWAGAISFRYAEQCESDFSTHAFNITAGRVGHISCVGCYVRTAGLRMLCRPASSCSRPVATPCSKATKFPVRPKESSRIEQCIICSLPVFRVGLERLLDKPDVCGSNPLVLTKNKPLAMSGLFR